MNVRTYINEALRTEKDPDSYAYAAKAEDGYAHVRLIHAAIGLGGEVGELIRVIDQKRNDLSIIVSGMRKVSSIDWENLTPREALAEEIGDVMWFWALTADVLSHTARLAEWPERERGSYTDPISPIGDVVDALKSFVVYGQNRSDKIERIYRAVNRLPAVMRDLAESNNIPWDLVLEMNISKLHRRYPEKFDDALCESAKRPEDGS